MKIKKDKATEDSDNYPNEAYSKEAKAPRRGVKADDEDEYSAKGSSDWNKSVEKGGAYRNQSHAPTGRGSRGPSQADGGPIKDWDVPVKEYGAYASQQHWDSKSESASLGFKLQGPESKYLGHMAQEKYLRQGHNDGPNMNMNGNSGSDPMGGSYPVPKATPQEDEDTDSGSRTSKLKAAEKSMQKAFKTPKG